MSGSQDTKTHIIESAISVLKAFGTEGLTMRKVAAEAEISLGNLQYHFKNQPALMVGLAGHYFDECAALLDAYEHTPRKGTAKAKLRRFVVFLLDHVDHISDMCRVFREIWALAARDADIHAMLVGYYRITLEKLITLLEPLCVSKEAAHSVASLLLPYIEGYSIAGEALTQSKKETAEMLVARCGDLCRSAQPA